jgi:hypothetical protein
MELDNSSVNLQDTLSQLDSNTSITSFKMKNCVFGKMKEFGAMKFTNKNLQHLDLSSIFDLLNFSEQKFQFSKDMTFLKCILGNDSLITLNLSGKQIGEKGINLLTNFLKTSKKIESLTVEGFLVLFTSRSFV